MKFQLQLLWNSNPYYKDKNYLKERFEKSYIKYKDDKEKLVNFFLDWWIDKFTIWMELLHKKVYIFYYPIDFKEENFIEEWFSIRKELQEFSAEIRDEEFNYSLMEHIKIFFKLFSAFEEDFNILAWWKLSFEDKKTLLAKIVFHDLWRIITHEENLHQELENYLWLINVDEKGKKIESEWEDYKSIEKFKNLSNFSILYSFLDTFAKKDSNIFKYFFVSKEDKIETILKERYANVWKVGEEENLRLLLDKLFLEELVNLWYKTFDEVNRKLS